MRSEVTTPGAVDWAHARRPPSEAVAKLPTARADCWRNLRRFMSAPLALGSSGDVRPQTERLGNDAEHLGVVQEAAHSIGARPHRRQHDVLAGMHALGGTVREISDAQDGARRVLVLLVGDVPLAWP